jgi:hypothetical protein
VATNSRFAVGDRVRRLRGRPAPGTVVRVVREEPELVVEVSWDSPTPPFQLTTMLATQLKRFVEEGC